MTSVLHLFGVVLLALLSACAPTQTKPGHASQSIEQAVQVLADDLLSQTGPSVLDRMVSRRVVLDPFLDGSTGQETETSRQAGQLLTENLEKRKSFLRIVPFREDTVEQADYLITGSIRPAGEARGAAGTHLLNASITDRRTGLVVAHATTRLAAGVNSKPTRFFSDSPSLVRDRFTEGYLRTSATPAGATADQVYLDSVPTAALVTQAVEAYERQQWKKAHEYYTLAAQRKDGSQLRVLNGLYLTHVQLGDQDGAEKAFARIVALGLATNNLAVRILFNPGSTEFWRDPRVSSAYPMWLRQIAKETRAGHYCLTVVGHTSRTGAESFNERLSLSRARAIRDALVADDRSLANQLRVDGVGFKENIVGIGSDDARDSLDRRVEFKVGSCRT